QVRVVGGYEEVPGHDGPDALGEGRPERPERLFDVAVGDDGHAVVGVDRGVAVPGEVLGAGGDPGGLQAADEGAGVAGDEFGVGAEGAQPDDGVVGVGVDVGGGREVDADAGGGQVLPQVAGERFGQGGVVHDAERVPAGTAAAGADLQPGHLAGLLVGADERVRVLRPQGPREAGDLFRVRDVAGEQHHSGQPVAEPAPQPFGRRVTRESRQEDGVGQAEEVAARRHEPQSNRKVSYLLGAFPNVIPYPGTTKPWGAGHWFAAVRKSWIMADAERISSFTKRLVAGA